MCAYHDKLTIISFSFSVSSICWRHFNKQAILIREFLFLCGRSIIDLNDDLSKRFKRIKLSCETNNYCGFTRSRCLDKLIITDHLIFFFFLFHCFPVKLTCREFPINIDFLTSDN